MIKFDLPEIPDALPMREIKTAFLEKFGIEYTGDRTWWHKYTDEELAEEIGPVSLDGKVKPATEEEVEAFKAKDNERLRKLAVASLRYEYFSRWIDGLSFDDLKREVKRVSKTPLTSWEMRTWAAHTYRECLLKLSSAYLPPWVTPTAEESKVERPTAPKKKRSGRKPKEGTQA